ncbi:MAG: peptidylprolyl isomerase [Desulfopila sp.]|nr:peptidylprolyl isomerase [Desulfopila sp.]
MITAKTGDKVTVHYTGKLQDGSIFDSTIGEDPLEFTLGDGQLIDGFEAGVIGMSVGEKKTVTLEPEQAHGEKQEEMLMEVPLADLPTDLELKVGDELEITDEDDEPLFVIVTALTEDTVTLDCASPLSGETLIFDLELVAIQ